MHAIFLSGNMKESDYFRDKSGFDDYVKTD
jgi:hypothetical protein